LGRWDGCVREESLLSRLPDFVDPHLLFVCLVTVLNVVEIGVVFAFVCQVANLSTALADLLRHWVLLILSSYEYVLFLLIIPWDMFIESTSRRILISFSTAPVDLA
jgi:hypothetical protein